MSATTINKKQIGKDVLTNTNIKLTSFDKKAEEMKAFLKRNPIPAQFIKK